MRVSWSSSGSDLYLDWHPDSGRLGLADALRAAIREGRLGPRSALPSTRVLARDLGIARGTVTRVYAQLAAEGYLRTSQGAPTTVRSLHHTPAAVPPVPAVPAATARWDLRPCRPDPSAFPRQQWLTLTRRVMQRTSPSDLFGYGDEFGPLPLRAALSRYLARARGVVASPGRIALCAGFSHAMALLCRAFRNLGIDEIAFEDPGLASLRRVAATAGHRVVGVPVDESGIDVSAVHGPALVVTPAHQFPTGATLAPERRSELVGRAGRNGTLIVEDDYDGEFRFDRRQVGALQALAPERVVYAGTASKTLAPSLRIGWLVLPRALVEPMRVAIAETGWHQPALDQLVLAELIDSGGYDQHVRRCRAAYRRRRDRLLAAMPDYLTPRGISAGLHVLLSLPEGAASEQAVLAAARRHSVELGVLGDYWVSEGPHPQGLVVGFTTPAEHAFGPTLDAFLAALREVY
ncbi:PLP-dependent aminotransferase family protein [Actinokineospora enzanensis]|uniref:MocR-like pyridoxine biosynthesis transcription factor PdxR n=1 Tax=Actinokineospora enzanensis TaxID=155975 RepID=UPI00036C79DA|nr:PLP-dependent aminotransferase family protein [Actinokineospora enzanensis]